MARSEGFPPALLFFSSSSPLRCDGLAIIHNGNRVLFCMGNEWEGGVLWMGRGVGVFFFLMKSDLLLPGFSSGMMRGFNSF